MLVLVTFAQVKDIFVVGHYQCGGVRAAMQNQDHGLLEFWLRNIRDVAVRDEDTTQQAHRARQAGGADVAWAALWCCGWWMCWYDDDDEASACTSLSWSRSRTTSSSGTGWWS